MALELIDDIVQLVNDIVIVITIAEIYDLLISYYLLISLI